jgi:uncharacterized membrane protein YdjX (TVP38/TMEM64 family)
MKERRQIVLAVLGVAAFMAIAHFTPLRAWITNVQSWKAWIRDVGWPAHGGFALATAVGVMLGVPRLPLCGAAGLIFGFAEGLGLSLVGSTMGSYGAFLLSRVGVRRLAESRTNRWPWLAKLLNKPSLVRVIWVRQIMVPGVVLNVLLGMTRVRHRIFWLGTLIGYLPLNVAFSLVGSGMGKGNLAQTLGQLLGALAVVHGIAWVIWRRVKSDKGAGKLDDTQR